MGVTVGRRLALLSVPLGYASLLSEQGQPVPLANDLQLFSFRWQSLFRIGWQWTSLQRQKPARYFRRQTFAVITRAISPIIMKNIHFSVDTKVDDRCPSLPLIAATEP